MNEIGDSFNEYLLAFKDLEIPDKRQEIIHAINEITASFDMLANESNIPLSYLRSREINDLKKGFESEDDYLEALLVYIENAKSVLGQYLAKISNE
jgi:hypothetical protein